MNNKVLVVVIIVIVLIAGVFALRQYRKNKLSDTVPSQTIEQQSNGSTGSAARQGSGSAGTKSNLVGTTELDDELKDLDKAIDQQSVDDVDLNF